MDDRLEHVKREALAEFAAGAGHEINNPVATIVGRVQMLLQDETDEDRRQQLLTIGAQALRIRDMIGDLMVYGRPPRPLCAACDLSDIVRGEAPKLEEAATARGAQLTFDATAPVPIHADRVQVCVVIHALVRNSLEALRSGGTVRVSASRAEDGRGGGILTVADDGPGLSDADRRHLFDPFYSGRQAGRGLGFGLPKCERIVRAHGGRIDVASQPSDTRFAVWWPKTADTGP
jgi:signal transduction histidine kinase